MHDVRVVGVPLVPPGMETPARAIPVVHTRTERVLADLRGLAPPSAGRTNRRI